MTPARTPDQLDAILLGRTGSLQDTPYPILLLALALREKSAVLSLRRNQLQKEIVFNAGSPVECRSNIATETLGRFLVASGKISEPDCHAALAAAASRGVSLEEVLSERKLLSPTDLYRMVQQNLGRKLLEPFSWKTGTYEISYNVPAVESSLHVKVPQLVVTGVLKVETQETVDEMLESASGKFITSATDPLFALEELRLTPEQQKILEAAQRGTALTEMPAVSSIPESDANRIIYALVLLGVVRISEQLPQAIPFFELEQPLHRKPLAEPPETPTQPSSPQVTRVDPAAAEEVMTAYLVYLKKDAVDLLGVAESDGLIEITKAFLRMADKFFPSKFDDQAADGLREKAQQLFLAAARAYAELADPERREALGKKRLKKRQDAMAAAARARRGTPDLSATVPTRKATFRMEEPAPAEGLLKSQIGRDGLIDPEALCRTGRELSSAGKMREALSYFEMAVDCDAQNGTYAAEVAWCRFQLLSSPAATALKLLQNAIRIDPGAGLAHLYAGRIETALGNRREAEIYLNRAAFLMPRDLRVVDARKALREPKKA